MQRFSGRSAVRLAHLLWEQGVEGSNPFTPTNNIECPGGGMVDALVSGASAARRAGSSPVLGTPIKSQVIKNQLLAIFTFRNCQQNVSEPRKSQRFNPAEPQQIQLNKPNLSLLTFFNTPYGSGIVFLSLDFILSTDFSIVSPSHHNKARQRFSFR